MVARRTNQRVPRRSRNRRSNNTGPILLGCFLIVAASIALAALVYLWILASQSPKFDDKTLCPESGPVGKLSILIDMTDPISQTQRAKIINWMNREIENANVGTKVTLGVVSPNDTLRSSYSLSLCKPPSGEDANEYYENERLFEKRFTEDFIEPLYKALDLLLEMEQARSSPIMESLQFMIAQTGSEILDHRLILISDLLQHSDAFSFYRGERWEDLFRERQFGRSLEDAEVLLLSIQRPDARVAESLKIDQFWAEYFDLQGVADVSREIIGDL